MSDGEARLWARLKSGQLGARFTRQLPVGDYILDFACRTTKLAVEVDGDQHGERLDYDLERSRWLMTQGWRVLRVSARDAIGRTNDVIGNIAAILCGDAKVDDIMAGHPAHVPSS